MILGSKMGLFWFGKLEMFNEIRGKLGSFGKSSIFLRVVGVIRAVDRGGCRVNGFPVLAGLAGAWV
jgi:hypothetical protein